MLLLWAFLGAPHLSCWGAPGPYAHQPTPFLWKSAAWTQSTFPSEMDREARGLIMRSSRKAKALQK